MREAADKAARLGETANLIAKPEVRQLVGRLSVTADEILQELSKHPERIELARSFLTYYLDAALRVAGGYQELTARTNPTPEMTETIARAESSLPGIQQAFESQLSSLLQVDLLDLDSEIALLEKMADMNQRFDEARGVLPPTSSRTSGEQG
jgi:hypothetical protein